MRWAVGKSRTNTPSLSPNEQETPVKTQAFWLPTFSCSIRCATSRKNRCLVKYDVYKPRQPVLRWQRVKSRQGRTAVRLAFGSGAILVLAFKVSKSRRPHHKTLGKPLNISTLGKPLTISTLGKPLNISGGFHPTPRLLRTSPEPAPDPFNYQPRTCSGSAYANATEVSSSRPNMEHAPTKVT